VAIALRCARRGDGTVSSAVPWIANAPGARTRSVIGADLNLEFAVHVCVNSTVSTVVALAIVSIEPGITMTEAAYTLSSSAAIQAGGTIWPAPISIAYACAVRRTRPVLTAVVGASGDGAVLSGPMIVAQAGQIRPAGSVTATSRWTVQEIAGWTPPADLADARPVKATHTATRTACEERCGQVRQRRTGVFQQIRLIPGSQIGVLQSTPVQPRSQKQVELEQTPLIEQLDGQ
jgi:hypothetical protein